MGESQSTAALQGCLYSYLKHRVFSTAAIWESTHDIKDIQMDSILKTLEERGFVAQCTEGLRDLLEREKVTVYVGFDPTAASLHIGHLVPLMALAHFRRAGHRVLVVLGGTTAMVGDPSGRSAERPLLESDQVDRHLEAIAGQVRGILDPEGTDPPTVLNNADWLSTVTLVEWLRDVGKHFPVAAMIGRESVRSRLESGEGITLTEFVYMTIQATDFLHLFRDFGCVLQCGGSDQWGNITSGIELVRRRCDGAAAFGLTFPLITTASGEKIGSTTRDAVWLDPERTAPYELYQHFVRQDDRDVGRFMRLYTFLPITEIEALEASVRAAPEERRPQKALAFEVTRMVHGERTAQQVATAAGILYGTEIRDLSDELLETVFSDVPATEIRWEKLEGGIPILDLLVETGLVSGKNEGRRLLNQGGIYVNNVRVDPDAIIGPKHLASESFIVLRVGRRRYHLVRVSRSHRSS